MPNGWYPVPGLSVVLINRTEQRYPRIEWAQVGDELWATEIVGARGATPRGALEVRALESEMELEDLVEAARRLIASEPNLSALASVVLLNFKQKVGWAAGAYCVYGFKDGEVVNLHDHTLGAEVPKGVDPGCEAKILEISTTRITAAGLPARRDGSEPEWRFEFGDVDALVVSSVPLHYDAHWPPKNSLDCVVMALARDDSGDTLIALWKPESKAAG